jgi:hypothetical protein
VTTNHVTTTDTFDTVRAALAGMPGMPPLPPDADTAGPFPLPVPGRWANPSGRAPQQSGIVLFVHGGPEPADRLAKRGALAQAGHGIRALLETIVTAYANTRHRNLRHTQLSVLIMMRVPINQ